MTSSLALTGMRQKLHCEGLVCSAHGEETIDAAAVQELLQRVKDGAEALPGLRDSEHELAAKVARGATAEEATARREAGLIRGRDDLLVKAAACAPCKSALECKPCLAAVVWSQIWLDPCPQSSLGR
jgi:hypothetical protein